MLGKQIRPGSTGTLGVETLGEANNDNKTKQNINVNPRRLTNSSLGTTKGKAKYWFYFLPRGNLF